jgi:hypothetical protein
MPLLRSILRERARPLLSRATLGVRVSLFGLRRAPLGET